MTQVSIGQTLFQPNPRTSGYREYKVIKIGRKWISFEDGRRCTIDTLLLDCGGYAPQKLYVSVEEYEAGRKLQAAWSDLCRDVQRIRRPEHLTVEGINEIRRMLGLQVLSEAP